MTSRNHEYTWGTLSELKFIFKLGSHRPEYKETQTRDQLLRNYLTGVEGRVNWGELDPYMVIEFARSLLKGEEISPGEWIKGEEEK